MNAFQYGNEQRPKKKIVSSSTVARKNVIRVADQGSDSAEMYPIPIGRKHVGGSRPGRVVNEGFMMSLMF